MKPYYEKDDITIYHGDCREVLPELPKVDLVLTDPPYSKKFDYVWDILGDDTHKIMKDGSFLLTLLGHYQLSRVIQALNKNLDYHWCCMLPNNMQPIMHGWNFKVCWKPILVYTKGKPRKHKLMLDDFGKRKVDTKWMARGIHKWGQSEQMAVEPILGLTEMNDFIIDPFMGSGTTITVANLLERKAIGIEIEEKYCEIAVKRLEDAVKNKEHWDNMNKNEQYFDRIKEFKKRAGKR